MKWLYVASLLLFEGGSALCGGSPNMNVSFLQILWSHLKTLSNRSRFQALIIGRVVAGAGGAGVYLGWVFPNSTNLEI